MELGNQNECEKLHHSPPPRTYMQNFKGNEGELFAQHMDLLVRPALQRDKWKSSLLL